jgi:hypothetical protein
LGQGLTINIGGSLTCQNAKYCVEYFVRKRRGEMKNIFGQVLLRGRPSAKSLGPTFPVTLQNVDWNPPYQPTLVSRCAPAGPDKFGPERSRTGFGGTTDLVFNYMYGTLCHNTVTITYATRREAEQALKQLTRQ